MRRVARRRRRRGHRGGARPRSAAMARRDVADPLGRPAGALAAAPDGTRSSSRPRPSGCRSTGPSAIRCRLEPRSRRADLAASTRGRPPARRRRGDRDRRRRRRFARGARRAGRRRLRVALRRPIPLLGDVARASSARRRARGPRRSSELERPRRAAGARALPVLPGAGAGGGLGAALAWLGGSSCRRRSSSRPRGFDERAAWRRSSSPARGASTRRRSRARRPARSSAAARRGRPRATSSAGSWRARRPARHSRSPATRPGAEDLGSASSSAGTRRSTRRELLDLALRGVELRSHRRGRAPRRAATVRSPRRVRRRPRSSRSTICSSSRWASSKVGSSLTRRARRTRRRRPRWRRASPGATAASRTTLVAAPDDRVAALERRLRRERGQPGRRRARAPRACARPRAGARAGGARAPLEALRSRSRRAACAAAARRRSSAARPARARARARASARARGRAARQLQSSGTTSRPAIVGVDARTSAARSQSGVSCSCPTAETTGTGHAATARTSRSSLNGSRSSKLPPPRASTITSTPGARRARRSASTIPGAARGPWTYVSATSTCAGGKRLWIAVSTSRFAAASLPVTSPIRRGQPRQRALPLGREQPFGRELRLQPLERREVRAEAEALDRERAQAEVAALLEQLGPAEDVHALAVVEVEPQRVELPARHRARRGTRRRRDPSA